MHTYFDLYSKRALIILAFAAVPVLPLRAQVGLGLTPMRMEFAAEAGRQYSGSLTLSNSSDSRTRARTQLLDFTWMETPRRNLCPMPPRKAPIRAGNG